jgi:thioredoxin reductase
MDQSDKAVADVLIIGGGHAGLSAALTLYRAMHTTVIFDSHKPRNNYGTAVRLTSTWENQQPDRLRQESRKELQEAGFTTFVDAEVTTVAKNEQGIFAVTDDSGSKWLGRKILLATGARDVFPDLPGYDSLFARGIYPCMFQFGFEVRGSQSAGLLAIDGLASSLHATILAKDGYKFTNALTIYTNDNATLAEEISASLTDGEFSVDNRKIKCLSRGEGKGVVIDFEDGSKKEESFMIHRPLSTVDQTLINQLGLALSAMGNVEAPPPFCKTNVAGVFAAGDCASIMRNIPNAMTMGSYAGCGLARELPKATA